MVQIGKINNLDIIRETENGIYLDGKDLGEILMPKRFITEEIKAKGNADVFIYTDSEDRLVATTEKPFVKVDELARLKVIETNRFGAFLDWGLAKDLLVPFSEQTEKMETGKTYLVAVYLDKKTNRIVASAKLNKFLDNTPPQYETGEKVEAIVVGKTPLGFKVVVNKEHWGILYENEIFQPLENGQVIDAFVKKVRNDDKIDLILEKPGYEKIDDISEKIISELNNNNGFLALNDKSSPEMVKALLGISKKNFKKAVGNLYRKRLITFDSDGIRVV